MTKPLTSLTLDQATQELVAMARTNDGSNIESLMEWMELDQWRSFAAQSLWIYLYLLILRHGDASHIKRICQPSSKSIDSEMDRWIADNRRKLGIWLGYRQKLDRIQEYKNAVIPRTKTAVMSYIEPRIGHAQWQASRELVDLVKAQKFDLICEEGFHVLAALMLHGKPEHIKELRTLALSEPALVQVLTAHGIEPVDVTQGELLLQKVFVAPSDDDPRWVYSDWLMELEDSQGDFIRAQLSGEEVGLTTKRRKLFAGAMRQHIRWSGAHVAPVDYEDSVVIDGVAAQFDRGFLHACTVNALDGTGLDTPGWEAIEVLDLLKGLDKICDYPLTSLRFLGGVQGEDVKRLLHSPVGQSLEGLALRTVKLRDRAVVWDLLEQFPSLRHLRVCKRSYDDLGPLSTHPIMKKLTLHYDVYRPGRWLDTYRKTRTLLA